MPTDQLTFSIIVPLYNSARYLAETIQSILAQTYPHFQVLGLESCSTDNTVAILEGFHDPRIQIIPSDHRLSIEKNWARILDLPLADYMTIAGHDDRFEPGFLQEIVRLIQAEPQASLYTTHFNLIDSEGAELRPCIPTPYYETADEYMYARQRYNRNSFGMGYVMRSDDYKRIGGIPPVPGLLFADDLLIYLGAKLGVKVCSPEFLFAYRYHHRSSSYGSPLEEMYQGGKGYLLKLTQAGYMDTEAKRTSSRKFVEKTFNRHCHRLLVNLILANDEQGLTAYRQTKQQLLSWEAEDHLFTVYDPASKVTDTLLNLPIRPLRQFAAWLIEQFGVMTRWIRK